jgi:hypothetical protein
MPREESCDDKDDPNGTGLPEDRQVPAIADRTDTDRTDTDRTDTDRTDTDRTDSYSRRFRLIGSAHVRSEHSQR